MWLIQALSVATLASVVAIAIVSALRRGAAACGVDRRVKLVSAVDDAPLSGGRLYDPRSQTITFAVSDNAGCLPVPKRWGSRLRLGIVIRGRIVLCNVHIILGRDGPFVIAVP